MENSENDNLIFSDSVTTLYPDRYLHILCIEGKISFTFNDKVYEAGSHDYIIFTETHLVTNFKVSDDFRAIILWIKPEFSRIATIGSNYDVVGRLSIMQNPVINMNHEDYFICLEDLEILRNRNKNTGHLFRHEMTASLLNAHACNLYDIHSRLYPIGKLPERSITILRKFLGMLQEGEYRRWRSVSHYADRICITPHYLTEICREVTGQPATYWIDRFTIQSIITTLVESQMSVSEVAELYNFSTVQYFSEYFKRKTGIVPSKYRLSTR